VALKAGNAVGTLESMRGTLKKALAHKISKAWGNSTAIKKFLQKGQVQQTLIFN
jgi:myosin heavy subunit